MLVPLQVLWTDTSQRNANANSLVAIIPIALAALPIYYFRKGAPQLDLHVAVFLIVGSVVGAYLGARFLRRIPDLPLKVVVAFVLAVVGAQELVFP